MTTPKRKKEPTAIGDILKPESVDRRQTSMAIVANGMTELAKIESRADLLEINGEEQLAEAAESISLAQKVAKRLEEQRIELTKPILDEKAEIDARFKPLVERVKRLKEKLTAKVDAYRSEQRERMRAEQKRLEEEAERNRLAALLEAPEASQDLGIDIPAGMLEAPAATPVVQAPASRVATASGGISERTVWTFEIEIEGLVPREYLSVNEAKIREAVRKGTREIPGVRIFQKTTTVAI